MGSDSGEISRRAFVGGSAIAATALAAGTAGAAQPPASRIPQIFATGGGFFAEPWEKSLFPEYLLALTPAKMPKICWIGAASGESGAIFEIFARGMENYPCRIAHFNIFEPATLDFVDYLMGMDIIFVGGGSTRNMMALWREWEFDKALHAAWQAGVVMAGGSAGMICWFQSGLTDSFPKVLAPVRGLGLLPGSASPHYDGRPDHPTQFRKFIADGSIAGPGLALDHHAAVLYRGDHMIEIVSERKEARAFRLLRTPAGYAETPLPVRYLGT